MSILEVKANVTRRKQTTIPKSICQALEIEGGEQLSFKVLDDGTVLLSKAQPQEADQDDPMVNAFLKFVEAEILREPARLSPLTSDHAERIAILTSAVDANLNLDSALDPNDE